jgi:hypothetical protein
MALGNSATLLRQIGMKVYGLIFFTSLLIAAFVLHGQEAAPPSVNLLPDQGPPEEEDMGPSLPPNGPELPGLKELDNSFKPKSMGPEADALRVHVLWRELKNRTVNDPEVQAARKYAQAARTDLEKRNRLRTYYEVYYQRMTALATTPELKLALQALKANHQNLLAQPRVRPTPDTSTPSPTPSGTPVKKKPAQKPKKKKKKKIHS